jgi:phosphohistidine phosphatase
VLTVTIRRAASRAVKLRRRKDETGTVSRRLLLLRHAKAAPHGADDDRDRPLLPVGRDAAALVGRFLGAAGCEPDLVLTSPATRARATADLACEAAGWSCAPREIDALYDVTTRGALDVLRREGGGAATLLLVGHEPAWSDLASRLVGGGAIRLPTGGVVLVELEVESWSETRFGSGALRWMVTPKLLAALDRRGS